MDTTPLPPPGGAEPSAASNVLGLPVEAAPTALGLRILAGAGNLLELVPERLAARLYPAEPRRAATERVILHVLMLEEAGHLRTWVEDGHEWVSLLAPFESPPVSPSPPPAAATTVGPAPPFSPAGERGREGTREREQARAQARERARVQAEAEERARMDRWAAWDEEYGRGTPSRPVRPALLDAPPIGCHEHPNGSLTPCGPCGTAGERRREYLAKHKYLDQLAIFEEQWGDDDGSELGADGQPF